LRGDAQAKGSEETSSGMPPGSLKSKDGKVNLSTGPPGRIIDKTGQTKGNKKGKRAKNQKKKVNRTPFEKQMDPWERQEPHHCWRRGESLILKRRAVETPLTPNLREGKFRGSGPRPR